MASFDPEAHRSLCILVAQQRNAGVPDVMIAAGLGVTVETLRRDCPRDDADPLGLHPPYPLPTPHRPRGHVGDPFENLPTLPPSPPSENGGGLALLVLFFFLG